MNEEKKTMAQRLQESKERSEAFNEVMKELLLYVGFGSAIISAIAYIVITIVMITGFTADFSIANQLVFSILGALVGLSISFSLRSQGIAFAKRDENAQQVMKDYYDAINKTKKEKELHSIEWHLKRATLYEGIVKGTVFILSTFFVLYIFIEGSGNWGLLGLAFANIFMFTGFGLVGLSSMYDKYLEEHIPVIEERIKRINKDNDQNTEEQIKKDTD